MASIDFTLKSNSDSISFSVSSELEEVISWFFHTFTSLFPGAIDLKNSKLTPINNTPEVRNNVESFVQAYQNKIPALNQIPAFFRRLNEDELFFVFPFSGMEQKQAMIVHTYLAAIAENKDLNTFYNQFNELFDNLLDTYEIGVYGEQRMSIGEQDRSKRVCRFCRNTRTSISFKNKAHAISEALGNKTVVLLDECDACNTEFSQKIEPDIVEYLALIRTMYDIKGKGGSKKFKGKNFSLQQVKEEHEKFILEFESEDSKEFNPDESLIIPLQSTKKISAQNIYKTLCKYFLSVIDTKYLPHFQRTMDWLNGEIVANELPKVAKMEIFDKFEEQPVLTTYIRKVENKSIPFAVGELKFAFIRFIFIVPFTSQDELTFLEVNEYLNNFWNRFNHYSKIPNVSFNNFSSNEKRDFKINLKIILNEQSAQDIIRTSETE